MKRLVLTTAILTTTLSMNGVTAEPALTFTKVWTHNHGTAQETSGQVSEIPAFDPRTNTIWAAGIVGVDVLNADTGVRVAHIDVTGYGFVNSVAIHNGLAALAVEAGPSPAPGRARPGRVLFFDTKTRELSDGVNDVPVGALPDMLTFTHDGAKLLVANEGTPNGRTCAFIGLERTLKSAVAIFDVTDPTDVTFVDMIVTNGDLSPEGLATYHYRGQFYLAISNEVPPAGGTSNTTLYRLDRVLPKP